MSEFSDRALVAGSLTGIRSFKVDGLGRLTGVSYASVWLPGVNEAECRKSKDGDLMGTYMSSVFARWYGGGGYYPTYPSSLTASIEIPKVSTKVALDPSATASVVEAKPPHTVAGVDCTCGFYAYFDEEANPNHQSGQIHGLIEGTGIATVGTRGFRVEKARLIALVIKPGKKRIPQPIIERVLHNYPDAGVYQSKADAFAAHPLTVPDFPTPESSVDFWTRSA